MLSEVVFTSRAQAERQTPPPNWAVISITEPSTTAAALQDGWHDVLRLKFDDVDVATDEAATVFSPEDAVAVLHFVTKNASEVEGILVHCFAGISRSAAIAKFIADMYRLRFPASYSIYNKQVYRRLNQAQWDSAVEQGD